MAAHQFRQTCAVRPRAYPWHLFESQDSRCLLKMIQRYVSHLFLTGNIGREIAQHSIVKNSLQALHRLRFATRFRSEIVGIGETIVSQNFMKLLTSKCYCYLRVTILSFIIILKASHQKSCISYYKNSFITRMSYPFIIVL